MSRPVSATNVPKTYIQRIAAKFNFLLYLIGVLSFCLFLIAIRHAGNVLLLQGGWGGVDDGIAVRFLMKHLI